MNAWAIASILTTFYLLLGLAFYSAAKLCAVLTGRQAAVFKVTVVWTLVFIVLTIVARQYWTEAYRWLAYYLGVISFAFFISIPFWLALAIASISDFFSFLKNQYLAHLYVFLVAVVSIVAVVNYHRPPTVVEYNIYSDKLTTPVKLLQLSDVQYGSISRKEMDQRFKLAYAQNPDLIVFTGDLIDFDFYEFEDFAVLAESPVPILFERGNHEFYHDPTRLLNYLQEISSIRLLINQRAIVGELEIVGVDYGQREGHLATSLATIARNPAKFSILLYHEPNEVDYAAEQGFDLLLFGHTHAGQIWPYTWLVDKMYKYGDGLFQLGEATAYTSDGVALWGPKMRLGSQNEMVVFNLLPQL